MNHICEEWKEKTPADVLLTYSYFCRHMLHFFWGMFHENRFSFGCDAPFLPFRNVNDTLKHWQIVLISCSLAASRNELCCDWKLALHLLLLCCFHHLCDSKLYAPALTTVYRWLIIHCKQTAPSLAAGSNWMPERSRNSVKYTKTYVIFYRIQSKCECLSI